ncbi:hypothetical protein FRB99_001964 [Tulasnella sp. 403]|nr:hypothetical protein FRB99_001964 [Tulasnella sp. 403]
MAAVPNFSRLQLAAALLEYDNDLDDPNVRKVNAKESAIFAHLRRPPPVLSHYQGPGHPPTRRNTDYMPGSSSDADALNPGDGGAVNLNDDDAENQDDNMLASWGLNELVPKVKTETRKRTLQPGDTSTARTRTISEHGPKGRPSAIDPSTGPQKRSLSVGNLDDIVVGKSPERRLSQPMLSDNRQSMNVALDFAPEGGEPSPYDGVEFPDTEEPPKSSELDLPNPFAIPLSANRTSRFDPKAVAKQQRQSTLSAASDIAQNRMSTMSGYLEAGGEGSSVPGTSRARTMSMGTLGTQMMLEGDPNGEPFPSPGVQDPRRLTRLELLRPKVLVMPSPLQDSLPRGNQKNVRDGFFTTDDEDGEQIEMGWSEEEDDEQRALRPAGKLYGKSLIDDLETRKAIMKGKQRVFTGDNRPSMMQRGTFVDSSGLPSRPSTQYLTPSQVQEDVRRKRASGAPLVNFDNETPPGPTRPAMPGAGMGTTKSVFGVDKVWERELAKLKAAEEAEKTEEAKLQALDMRMEDKRKSAAATRGNPLNTSPVAARAGSLLAPALPATKTVSPIMADSPLRDDAEESSDSDRLAAPTTNKRMSQATLGTKGWFASASDDEDVPLNQRSSMISLGSRPMFSRKVSTSSRLPRIPGGGDDSDEDVPLAQRNSYFPTRRKSTGPTRPLESDSDEDKPIAVLQRRQSKDSKGSIGKDIAAGLAAINFDDLGDSGSTDLQLGASATTPTKLPSPKQQEESSEDEVPLAVRHPDAANRLSTMPSVLNAGGDSGDEDDKPLGVKFNASPAVQQQQQMQMMQQQMLQQQIMMQTQAQIRASMAFSAGAMMNPSLMGSGFAPFAPAPPMSMHSMNMGALAAAQEAQAAQLSRVDQWRRQVQ